MKCDEIIEIYLKSLRSNLCPEESALLNEHINKCEDCKQALKLDSVITDALLRDKEIIPEKDFVVEVIREITCERLSFKQTLYEFLDSSIGVLVPTFVIAVFLFFFQPEIENVLLPNVYSYYDKLIYGIHSHLNVLKDFSLPDKLFEMEIKKPTGFIWICIAGLIGLIITLSIELSSYKRR